MGTRRVKPSFTWPASHASKQKHTETTTVRESTSRLVTRPRLLQTPSSKKMPYSSAGTHHVSEALELDGVAGCEGCHDLGNLADKVGHLVAKAPERQAKSSSGEVQAVAEACHLRLKEKTRAEEKRGAKYQKTKTRRKKCFRCENPGRTDLLLNWTRTCIFVYVVPESSKHGPFAFTMTLSTAQNSQISPCFLRVAYHDVRKMKLTPPPLSSKTSRSIQFT